MAPALVLGFSRRSRHLGTASGGLNDPAADMVAESIRQFGFRQPIVLDADGVIVCGHTRWKAARKLGLKRVPVHVAKDLTPEQIKAYRIADNKSADSRLPRLGCGRPVGRYTAGRRPEKALSGRAGPLRW